LPIVTGTGRRSMSGSSGVAPSSDVSAPPALRNVVTGSLTQLSLAVTGDPASSARNSPSCSCLASIHSASRTSARSARAISAVRGRPSSRFHVTTVGSSTRRSRTAVMSSTTS
jgi:hypothetical protein